MSYLKCPVTALKINRDALLSGQGRKLYLHVLNSHECLLSIDVFSSSVIHKFCENKSNEGEFLVIGGKSIRIVRVSDGGRRIYFASKEKQLNGWIWDGIWWSADIIYLISAHNTVLVWNKKTDTIEVASSCKEQCILYSATFSCLKDDLVVAVGTVFNKVLLWKPVVEESCDFVDPWKMFVGHEGVIFRVRFHPKKAQLLSVSDDRSIRTWCLVRETPIQVLYGHSARVWDAFYFRDNTIVSVGEDAMCFLWGKSGNVVRKLTGNKGKSIWSMDVDDEQVVTGGGDGSVRQWKIGDQQKTSDNQAELAIPTYIDGDYPRTLRFMNGKSLITSTNSGVMWHCQLQSQLWKKIDEDERFTSYCTTDVFDDFIAIGNLSGIVKIVMLGSSKIIAEIQAFTDKIFSFRWMQYPGGKLYLLVSGPGGYMKLLLVEIQKNELVAEVVAMFRLPYSKQRWITSSVLLISILRKRAPLLSLVCGDRRGSLHLFQDGTEGPVQSLLGVHGKTGVTQISKHNGFIYTTGRNGNFQKYKYDEWSNQLLLVDKQKGCKGMDWIEGLYFSPTYDIIVYGFYMQSYFAMWSSRSKEILFKIKCGGGYRAWSVQFPRFESQYSGTDVDNRTLFGYIKEASINFVEYCWSQNSHGSIIQEPFHGKEIVEVAALSRYPGSGDVTHWLLATCSEDTTINISSYNSSDRVLKMVHTIEGHIGGIKAIQFVSSQEINNNLQGYFISCGSRTSLKCWKIGFNFGQNFACRPLSEIYNPESKAKDKIFKSDDVVDDMRYMDCSCFLLSELYEELEDCICIICACSDGMARVYIYLGNCLETLCILDFHKHCILACRHTITSTKCIYVFLTATDGLFSVWDLTDVVLDFVRKKSNNNSYKQDLNRTSENIKEHVNKNRFKFHDLNKESISICKPLLYMLCHQSGINCLDLLEQFSGEYVVVTGGDDNALSYVHVDTSSKQAELLVKVTGAHISSVTGLKFLSKNIVVSTGIDQRVKIWRLLENASMILSKDIFTSVADVSGLNVWKDSDWLYIGVVGVGIEVFHLKLTELQ